MTPEEIQAAVDTAWQEGFDRGASPSVQVLLADMQLTEGGEPGSYAQGVQDGMTRAVRTLIRADVANYHDAWRAGFKAGQRSVIQPPGPRDV